MMGGDILENIRDCWSQDIHKKMISYTSSQLWRHIQGNSKESVAEETFMSLTKLSNKDLQLLANIRWLLSKSVQKLINDVAPRIIYKLSRMSVNEMIIDHNKIKGQVNWQRTSVMRIASGDDKSLFVYARRSQIFDLPENRLFLYLLTEVNKTAKSFSRERYMALAWYSEAEFGAKWLDRVSAIASKTERMLKIATISKISNTKEISLKFILAAKKSRQQEYRELALIGEDCQIKNLTPLLYLNSELKSNILEPINKDTLFEIAVLFQTMEAVKKCGWIEEKAGLIGGTSDIVSVFKKNTVRLNIYMQHIPIEFKKCSAYGPIMISYGLSDKMRRPDIVLEFDFGNNKQFLIIEVKRSEHRSYLADGIYKLLGYLKDFEKINSGYALSGFLVGWDGILDIEYNTKSEIGLFTWRNYSAGIESYLNKIY